MNPLLHTKRPFYVHFEAHGGEVNFQILPIDTSIFYMLQSDLNWLIRFIKKNYNKVREKGKERER